MRRRLGIVAAGFAAILAAACGGGSRHGWQPPVAAPAPPGARATAVAAGGTVLAVWTEERHGRTAVRSSSFEPNGAWSDPTTIQPPQTWDASYPTVAVGPRGDAVAVWSWYAKGRSVLMASRRPVGGMWEAPQALGPSVRGIYSPGAGIGVDGRVALAFSGVHGSANAVAGTVRGADAAWVDPVRLPTGVGGSPRVALAPDGRVYVATAGFAGARLTTRGPDEERWRPVPLPATGTAQAGAADVALATDDRGSAVIAWTEPGPRLATLWTATLGARGWSAPRVLDRAPMRMGFASLTAAPTSRGVVVAWSRWSTRWTRAVVRAATPDGPIRTISAFAIPDARRGPGRATPGPPPGWVVVGAGGDPVVMWDRLVARNPIRRSVLELSRMDDGGSWTPPEPVTPDAISGYPLAVGGEPSGLVATWAQYPAPGAPGARVLAAKRIG